MHNAEYPESPYATAEQSSSEQWGQPYSRRRSGQMQMSSTQAAVEFFQDYARERPEVVAMWAFGIGFILGWKLKPW
jgi:hypothetical protein